MLLAALNWMQVEAYLQRDDRVVVITGACEQHATLSVLADIHVPLAIAEAACEREGVLIAPPLPFGVSPYFTAYPGTLSLSPETFATVVREVLGNLRRQGFHRILVSNGHGGNTGILGPLISELNTAWPEVHITFFEWWRHPAVGAVAEAAGLAQYHANWSENFAGLTRVAPVPEGHKPPVTLLPGTSATVSRALLGDGSFGGVYQAPDAVMERFFAAAVEAMVTALHTW
ncbi:MAG TPA: creatininase family protein [Anaerolineae bacterium]|nr:creatininase family protein [Anaerolineae bacterium]HQK14297.1 creatininase family protein [Anaerolineae bacterium]